MADQREELRKDEEHELTDRPEQALESGEPGEVGRSQGRILDKQGGTEGCLQPGDAAEEQDRESGRHDATP